MVASAKTWQALDRQVWPLEGYERSLPWWLALVQSQLDEIEREPHKVVNEMADVLLIAWHYLRLHTDDPADVVRQRLQRRHAGNTDAITAKYDILFATREASKQAQARKRQRAGVSTPAHV